VRLVRSRLLRCASLALALASPRTAAAEPITPPVYQVPAYQFEVGPTLTYQTRSTKSDIGNNPARIRYVAGLAPGVFARITFLPWLRGVARFRASSHDITLPPGSLGVTNSQALAAQDSLGVVQLDAYVQPTLLILPRLRVWADIGVGWGRISMPPVVVDPQTPPPLILRSRAGIFLETPFGAGIGYDLVPNLVTISYDAMYEPIFIPQSGNMYEDDRYVDRQGDLQTVRPMPKLGHSMSQTLSIAIAL
jgi:hypothetical protein